MTTQQHHFTPKESHKTRLVSKLFRHEGFDPLKPLGGQWIAGYGLKGGLEVPSGQRQQAPRSVKHPEVEIGGEMVGRSSNARRRRGSIDPPIPMRS